MRQQVLIIGDDAGTRRLFFSAFAQAGYNVFEAAEAQAAMRIADEQRLNLLITDIVTPVKDRLEIINFFARALPHVNIIAIAGAGVCDDYMRIAMSLGAHAVFKAPVSTQLLLVTAERLASR